MAAKLLFLRDEEGGIRLHVYNDGAANPTIGIGHKLGPNEHYPDGITEADAERIFAADVAVATMHIRRVLGNVHLNDNELEALLSLVFNNGAAPLYGSVGKFILRGDRGAAGAAFELYHHGHGKGKPCTKVCDALLDRRKRERALFNKPVQEVRS